MEGREGKKNEKIKVWELKSEKKNEFTKETFRERHRTGRLPKTAEVWEDMKDISTNF